MIFFDYVFFRVCKAYSLAKGSSPEATAAVILALMQCCNIFTIVMVIEIVKHDKSLLTTAFCVALFLVFSVHNYIRYVYREVHNYSVISEKYVNDNQRAIKGTLVLLYIILSLGLVFFLAVFEGTRPWSINVPRLSKMSPKNINQPKILL